MMRVSVSQVKQKDISQILPFLEELSGIKSDRQKAMRSFKRLSESRMYFVFVARISEKIVGTASILIVPSLQHGQPWGYVDNVVVAEDYRRKGIGTKLGESLTNFAKKKKCYKIVLTSRFTRPEVHQFWEKLGFEKHGLSFRKNF